MLAPTNCYKDYGSKYTNRYVKELGEDILDPDLQNGEAYANFVNKLKKLKYDYEFIQDKNEFENCIEKNITNGLSTGAIIGITIAVAVFVLICIGITILIINPNPQNMSRKNSSDSKEELNTPKSQNRSRKNSSGSEDQIQFNNCLEQIKKNTNSKGPIDFIKNMYIIDSDDCKKFKNTLMDFQLTTYHVK